MATVPIQLPGREGRFAEPSARDVHELVAALLDGVRPLLDEPFALFGHSMGALVAFELARALRRRGGPAPVRLIVSGARAPHLPDRQPPTHTLPDPEFIASLRRLNGIPDAVLEQLELLQLLLPTLRADVTLCETYAYDEEPPLDCPITAYGGLRDQRVSPDEVDAWRHHTSAGFSWRLFSGDHFFVTTQRADVLRDLAAELVPGARPPAATPA